MNFEPHSLIDPKLVPQQQQQVLDKALDDCIIHVDTQFDTPQEILWVDDSVVATLGNFSVSTGKAKSRKTFNVSAIVAAALCNGTVLRYKAQLPENKRRILYIDTEQSQFHCQRIHKRILALSGNQDHHDNVNLFFYGLRNADGEPKDRLILTEHAIAKYQDNLGLVIIDGIRDMMYDINDSTESVKVVNTLMHLSAKYNIHIHVVLHLNKSDDHVRGHIGTELNNKAESVIVVSKSHHDAEVSEVSPLFLRDKDFKTFSFKVDDDGLPTDAYDYHGSAENKVRPKTFSDLTNEEHLEALDVAFRHTTIKGYKATIDALIDGYSSIGITRKPTTMSRHLKYLINKGTVVTTDKGTYCLKRDFPTLPLDKDTD